MMVTSLILLTAASVQPAPRLHVLSSPESTPCVAAALAAASLSEVVEHETASPLGSSVPADVIVASGVEVTRLLEGGSADLDFDVTLGEVSWFVRGSGQVLPEHLVIGPDRARLTVVVPPGPAAHEARRAVERLAPGRTRDARDLAEVDQATLAVVPGSWVKAGQRTSRLNELRPTTLRAVISASSSRKTDARALVRALTAEPARRAFAAACEGTSR